MNKKTIAIHQPNFFPWLPYFEKINRSDVFVILDDAQFSKKGGTWMNRVMINFSGVAQYLTAPVDRDYHGVRKISETRFIASTWRQGIKDKLRYAYGGDNKKYNVFMKLIESVIDFPSNRVVVYNIQAIAFICGILRMRFADKVVLSSQLGVESEGTQRLVDITKLLGGDVYLTGVGAKDYLEQELFDKEEIEVKFLEPEIYENQQYSVLDYFFNKGAKI